MTSAAGVVVRMPSHGMCHRQATKELANLLVMSWLHNKVPMVRHQDHALNRERNDFDRFVDHSHERIVVFRLLKDLKPGNRAVEDVKDLSCRAMSGGSWHEPSVGISVSREKRPDPFYFAPFSFALLKTALPKPSNVLRQLKRMKKGGSVGTPSSMVGFRQRRLHPRNP